MTNSYRPKEFRTTQPPTDAILLCTDENANDDEARSVVRLVARRRLEALLDALKEKDIELESCKRVIRQGIEEVATKDARIAELETENNETKRRITNLGKWIIQ